MVTKNEQPLNPLLDQGALTNVFPHPKVLASFCFSVFYPILIDSCFVLP